MMTEGFTPPMMMMTRSQRLELSGGGTTGGRSMSVSQSYASSRLKEREEWLNQWSRIWTKRQSPEWKPRRASVATCGNQQQNQALVAGTTTVTANNRQRLSEASVKELLRRHIQVKAQSCIPLTESSVFIVPAQEETADPKTISETSVSSINSSKTENHQAKHVEQQQRKHQHQRRKDYCCCCCRCCCCCFRAADLKYHRHDSPLVSVSGTPQQAKRLELASGSGSLTLARDQSLTNSSTIRLACAQHKQQQPPTDQHSLCILSHETSTCCQQSTACLNSYSLKDKEIKLLLADEQDSTAAAAAAAAQLNGRKLSEKLVQNVAELDGLRLQDRKRKSLIHLKALNRVNNSSSTSQEFIGRKVSRQEYLESGSNGIKLDDAIQRDQDLEETVSVSCSPLETQLPDLPQLHQHRLLRRSSRNSLTALSSTLSTTSTNSASSSTTCCHGDLANATKANDVLNSVVLRAAQVEETMLNKTNSEREEPLDVISLSDEVKSNYLISSSSSSDAIELKTSIPPQRETRKLLTNGNSEKSISNKPKSINLKSSIMYTPCSIVEQPMTQEERVDRLRNHQLETSETYNKSISSSNNSSRRSSSSSTGGSDTTNSNNENMNGSIKKHNSLKLKHHQSSHSTGSCDLGQETNLSETEDDEGLLDSEVEASGRLEVDDDADADEDEHELLARKSISSVHHQVCDCHSSSASTVQLDQQLNLLMMSSKSSEEELKQCNDNNNLDTSESQIVESWLDDHPAFVDDYFMRKATRRMIDEWLVTHAKVSNHLPAGQAASTSCQQYKSSNNLSVDINCCTPQFPVISDSRQRIFELSTPIEEHKQTSNHPIQGGSLNSTRSFSQSGHATPVRKISATDFESKTGSGFLRPMVSTTPDGRQTFLSLTSSDIQAVAAAAADEATTQENNIVNSNSGSQSNLLVDYLSSPSIASRKTSENNNDPATLHELDCVKHLIEGDDIEEEALASSRDEVRLIFELVKNICNDLDIRTLLHKILKNIAVLINADKSSLFLVRGEPGDPNRHLVSQLFNVDQDSEVPGAGGALASWNAGEDDCISIPWGTGLVGYVAESGESVNIANCYDDPRFTRTIDLRTGYVTRHMLCAPILDKRNEIVGVAQVINKRDGNPFTRADELKFKRYLQFCGIGLRNAQSYENCQLENRRNQVLLDLARMVFEEQSTIEQVVYRIMLHTQSLLECERCQVLLIDDGSEDLDQLLHLPASFQQLNSQTQPQVQVLASPAVPTDSTVKPPEWRPQCSKRAHRRDRANFCSRTNKLISSVSLPSSPATQLPQPVVKEQQQPKLFSLVFDLECDGNDPVMHSNKEAELKAKNKVGKVEETLSERRSKFPINIGITGYVAMTGETLNIEDAHKNERFDPSVDVGSNFRHKSILCMPIRNGQRQIIGVSQLINKKNGRPFNKNDEDLFEAFAIFCGLGIHNTLMYEKVLKIMAKQRVTFEVLSYHATAPLEEAKKLNMSKIPSCFSLNLMSLKFNDFSLDEQFMLKSCLRFFLDLDLMRRFQIDQLVFCNWILSVQKNYRKVTYHPIVGGNGLKETPVRYHNWRHAFNVSQMMFAILINTQICQPLGELETLALLIACLCHDLDHRGTNNSFQIKSASPLAQLYSTSTMEHHHFDQCVMILNSQGNQILANLSPEEYSRVIVLLEEAILATDLANYFQKRELFFRLVNSNQFEWQRNAEHRSLLRCMLMTACDVAAITKPWPVQKVVADLVMSEFYQQGDIEKQELNIEPSDMMNRDKMAKLPEMQIGFIDSICAPIYAAFASLFPRELKPLLEGCLINRNLWAELAKDTTNNNNNNNNNQTSKAQLRYLNQNTNTSAPTISLLPHVSYSKNLSETNLYHQNHHHHNHNHHHHHHHFNGSTCDQQENQIPNESRASSALAIDAETSQNPISEYHSSTTTINGSNIDEQRKSV